MERMLTILLTYPRVCRATDEVILLIVCAMTGICTLQKSPRTEVMVMKRW
jgi:hypothetical protein